MHESEKHIKYIKGRIKKKTPLEPDLYRSWNKFEEELQEPSQ